MSVIIAFIGLASPAIAGSSLADRPSSELMALLPDDAIPADWKVEKDDLVAASTAGDELCHHAGDSDGSSGIHFLVQLQALSHCNDFVVVDYGNEDAGFDVFANKKSTVSAQGTTTVNTGTATFNLSVADGPNTAPYPSATTLWRLSDAGDGDPGQLITVVRVRGLVVIVRSFAWDPSAGRSMLDQVVRSAITRLQAA